ncbi:DNA recombination protein RmuC [Patescibacteria group bacterium]|nr:DNA recombination protein RmuC [Patescibacteria group bacterium]MBU1500974.1 DNA recombination protein RmuC [Patescibacteria group bacterium]MBU2080604.1 DNA recombination protein RmuC [Patescibacteria group bacterium]MBU2124321.1 DNA recombination protein RmuC [Patescibacteria group bacterium]MBU2194447.1 DNA recombination protein RmuC [Patescibacteria group bacterium]
MNTLTIALIVLGLVFLQGVGLWLILRRKENQKDPSPESGGMLLLQKQIENLERSLDSRMHESSKQVNETMRSQLGESSRLIREITEEITSVKEIGRETGKFAEQLKNLQDILKNPKQRGILGEYYLETVLKNVLPPGMYRMQHPFENGEIVDAAVYVNDKIVPIDSKFSLDNYNRYIHAEGAERIALEKTFVNDLKLRITETAKYIRPEEGTMDFAFMFIPSEGIYYDLLTNQVGAGEDENLIQRAASKSKVIIVSPTSFLAYLQTVMQGLKALQIEKQAEEIQKRVGELGKHLGAYQEYYRKLGTALGTSVSHYNSGMKELGKIDKDVYRIAKERVGIELELLDKPGTGDED